MAVLRQANLLGQQRVDIPHLRALEAGVAGDFDLLAGKILAGKAPLTIKGFTVIETGALGNDASDLVVDVSEGALIHFNATESGSIFEVPADRETETLSATNSRVRGSFTPNTTNFIGLDLVRQADDSTVDTVQFISSNTNLETPKQIPLARTLDYQIVISTVEFSSTPGIAPLAKISTDASNKVVSIVDSRSLMFRLGSGGTTPNAANSFGWAGGRDESDSALSAAGDKSIFSLKGWIDSVMTRLWEVGGGEYWYSDTSNKNVRMGTSGTVFSNGEHFEWTGGNLHWRGVKFVFENSNGYVNEVANQLVNSAGVTDLLDGECVYVDIDRTQNRTSGLGNQLVAQKANYRTLGNSTTPGQRWVLAWRVGTEVFVRDRPFPVGFSWVIATSSGHGTVKLSAQPTSYGGSVFVPVISDLVSGRITAGGMSHHKTSNLLHSISTDGDINIGLGSAQGDQNTILITDGPYSTQIWGYAQTASKIAAAQIRQEGPLVGTPTHEQRIVDLVSNLGVQATAGYVESGGSLALRNVPTTPETPSPTATDLPRSKIFMRVDKIFTAVRAATFSPLPANTATGSGVGKTLIADSNGALTVDTVVLVASDLLLVKDETTGSDNGLYVVTHPGDGGNPYILTRATTHDQNSEWQSVTAFSVTEGSFNIGTYWINDSVNPLVVDTDDISVVGTTNFKKDQLCVIWHDGSISVIEESPVYT